MRHRAHSGQRRRTGEVALVIALLAGHGWLAVSSSLEKSLTFDEIAHLGGGILAAKTGDYRFNAESGILPQRWAAVPFWGRQLSLPPADQPARVQGNVWVAGREILYTRGNDAETLAAAARAMIAAASAALGWLVYVWSRSLFGRTGALLSLVLYAFSPTILAHGRMVTADLVTAFFFLLASGTLWRLLHRVTPARWAAAALALAGLLLSKHSGWLIVPIAAILVLVRLGRRLPLEVRSGTSRSRLTTPWRQALMITALAFVLAAAVALATWTAYGFRFTAAPGPPALPGGPGAGSTFVHSWESQLAAGGPALAAVGLARDLKLLPEAYLWGLAYTLNTTGERDAFLAGRTGKTGWWWFFPYAAAIKTPLALFALLLLALIAWARAGHSRRRRLRACYRGAPLWALVGVYGAVAVTSHLNIGHRHLLPVYPVMFILAGGAAAWLRRRHTGAVIALLAALFVLESWSIRPHYLAYFNQLVGGPQNGYRHLVDSSLDWGQDLPALAVSLEELRAREGEIPIYGAYFGAALPAYYGLGRPGTDIRWLTSYFPVADPTRPPPALDAGIYWVSATLLQSAHLGVLGPWSATREREYRARRQQVEHFVALTQDPAGREQLAEEKSVGEWMTVFRDFDRLRSARLFRTLRSRRPEARAGYSIHIYRLSAREIRAALDEPLPAE